MTTKEIPWALLAPLGVMHLAMHRLLRTTERLDRSQLPTWDIYYGPENALPETASLVIGPCTKEEMELTCDALKIPGEKLPL